jgi:hypothetical protein
MRTGCGLTAPQGRDAGRCQQEWIRQPGSLLPVASPYVPVAVERGSAVAFRPGPPDVGGDHLVSSVSSRICGTPKSEPTIPHINPNSLQKSPLPSPPLRRGSMPAPLAARFVTDQIRIGTNPPSGNRPNETPSGPSGTREGRAPRRIRQAGVCAVMEVCTEPLIGKRAAASFAMRQFQLSGRNGTARTPHSAP